MKQFLVSIGGLVTAFLLMMLALYFAGYKARSPRHEQALNKGKTKNCGSCSDCTCGNKLPSD